MIEIQNKRDCNGCKACGDICPVDAVSFETDRQGFWYPKVGSNKCISCGKCLNRCPNIHEITRATDLPKVYAAWSRDDDVRIASTSGGIFYELAKCILEDGGYVAGCVYNDDFKGAHHEIIHSMDKLPSLMVSKYVQSDTDGIYRKMLDALKTGKKVLFVGAPCQCAGLISFLGKEYDNLIICDFLCRGANSPKAHKKYVEYLEGKYGAPVKMLRSKDKRNGWEHFGQAAVFANGRKYFADRKKDKRVVAYHRGNLMARESCLDCKFKKIPRLADVSLGDFWGIPADEVKDIEKGISLVFVNSPKGSALFGKISERIEYLEKSLKDAEKGNPAIYTSAVSSKNREIFLNRLDEMPFDKLVNKYKESAGYGDRGKRAMKKIIKTAKALLQCGLGRFLKYNFLTFGIERKKGCYLFPYKGSVIQIASGGKLVLNGNLRFNAGKYRGSKQESYLVLETRARLIIDGDSRINYGSTVHVGNDAVVKIGSLTTNVGLNMQCHEKIAIGEDCMFGRNVTVFDSSFHPTGSTEDSMQTNVSEVNIGNHVWVGAGAFIMQGSRLDDGCIVGAGAYIRGQFRPATMIMAANDKPVSLGTMWARSMQKEDVANAVRFYEKKDIYEIDKEAVKNHYSRIGDLLKKQFPEIDFSSGAELLTQHKLDSLSIMALVALLSEEYGIEIPYYEISAENFNSIEHIATMVEKLRKQDSSGMEYDAGMKNTLVEYVKEHAKYNPSKIAVISCGTEYSYLELYRAVQKYSAFLRKMGLCAGDSVVVRSTQSVNYIIVYLSVHYCSGIITTLEKTAAADKIMEIAGVVSAKIIISNDRENLDAKYIYADIENVMSDLKDMPLEAEKFPDKMDSADILFTTGTTGESKGVELSHGAVIAGAENIAFGCNMQRDTVLIVPNPISHSNAIKNMGACFITGCTFYILDGIADLNAYFNALDYREGKIATVLPPAAIRTIFQLAKSKLADYVHRLDYLMAATAPLPEADRETLRELLPYTRLYNHYGCSESSSICIYDFNKYAELKNCAGKVMPHSHVFFVDDEKNEIVSSVDNLGLLAVRGDATMKGYYHEPELTDEILINDAIYTKDKGYIDDNGFVFIMGREDDVINVAGFKVSPLEVEEAALKYDGIKDCICIAEEDQITGKALKLLVVTDEGFDVALLKKYMHRNLESYKMPQQYELVNKIERTYNGKLNRKFYR